MYCIHCGKEIPDDSVLCPSCGLETDLAFQNSTGKTSKPAGKMIIGIAAAAAAVIIGIFAVRTSGRTVDKPCDWCGSSPSVAYTVTNDSDGICYVCRECSRTCMMCGSRRASKHFETLYGMIMFVCDDCSQKINY